MAEGQQVEDVDTTLTGRHHRLQGAEEVRKVQEQVQEQEQEQVQVPLTSSPPAASRREVTPPGNLTFLTSPRFPLVGSSTCRD